MLRHHFPWEAFPVTSMCSLGNFTTSASSRPLSKALVPPYHGSLSVCVSPGCVVLKGHRAGKG